MRIQRTCLHTLAAALTWSAVFALFHVVTLQHLGSDPSAPVADSQPGSNATTGRHQERLSNAEIRRHERTLARSSDGGDICESALKLYPQYICEIGHQAAVDRLRRHLARNRQIESLDLRSSSLTVGMKNGPESVAMLYTVTPPCSPVPNY